MGLDFSQRKASRFQVQMLNPNPNPKGVSQKEKLKSKRITLTLKPTAGVETPRQG